MGEFNYSAPQLLQKGGGRRDGKREIRRGEEGNMRDAPFANSRIRP